MFATYAFEEMRLPAELLAAVLLFLLPFSEKKAHFRIRAVTGYVGMLLFSLLFFVIFGDKKTPRWQFLTGFWYMLIALSSAVYAKLCFVISWCDALFLGIAAFAAQNVVYSVYHLFFARLLFPIIRLYLPFYIAGAVIVCAAVYIPLYRFFAPPLRKSGGHLFKEEFSTGLFYVIMFALMIVSLFFYQAAFANAVSRYDRMSWISGILVCVFLLLIQYSIVRGAVRVREQAILENMLRGSEHYYELSKEHIAIINRKCHDLKHQLRALASADDSERDAYIKEAQESVLFYQHLVYTDNEALNTILAEKGLFCQEKGIDFQCSVDDVDLSFLKMTDLYAILGNAIDNAIEYVAEQTDPKMRSISLRIAPRNQFLGIQVTNPYAGEKLAPNVLPETHKKDKVEHGFGMRSIRYLAQQYGGTMEFSTDGGLFTLQIVLPMH